MSGYILGRDAEQDLDDLWEYIAQDSVEAADRLIAEIFEAFQLLSRNPGIGHRRKNLTKFPVRFWPVGNYLVIYRAAGSLVEIVAIVHGKRDIPAFLRRRGGSPPKS
jgi:plasmid stabilization system protein ParE